MGLILPIPEWTPDLTNDGIGNEDDDTIANVVPDIESYRPWPFLNPLTGSITGGTLGRASGAIGAEDEAGNGYDFAGTQNHLYRLTSLTWTRATNQTLSATFSYSTSTDRNWEFVQWGNTVIATNGFNPMQEITLGGLNFVDLAGAPPVAYHIAVVRDFVMAGNIPGSPQMVRWCAINNTHSWTVDAATQADFQDLPGDGGHVQRVVGGNAATILQERAIWMGQYVGPPGIFSFGNGPVVKDIGCLAPQSVATFGGTVFFLAESGFYRLDSGVATPIGRNKIDRTFFNDLDSNYIHRIHAAVHPTERLYFVAYPGAGTSSGLPNIILVYHWETGRWTKIIDQAAQLFFQFVSTGYTLEALDNVSSSLDDLPASLDSHKWIGGDRDLGAFVLLNRMSLFTGPTKPVIATTREVQLISGRRSKVTRVRPLVDGDSAQLKIAPITRNRLGDERIVGTPVAPVASGDCPIRANSHYISFQITSSLTATTVSFTRIRGIEVLDFSDSGNR